MYVYILEGHWDARHVRPLTFNTHIFCQCNSIRVNGSRADGGEGPRGPCYLLQTVMNESRKRRPNSICMFTSSSSAASSSLRCALSDVDVYDVSLRSKYIAYTYKNLPQCCCSVHANNLSCIQRFRGACAFNEKKKTTDGLSYGRAGNPNPTYFSVRPYKKSVQFMLNKLICLSVCQYILFLKRKLNKKLRDKNTSSF